MVRRLVDESSGLMGNKVSATARRALFLIPSSRRRFSANRTHINRDASIESHGVRWGLTVRPRDVNEVISGAECAEQIRMHQSTFDVRSFEAAVSACKVHLGARVGRTRTDEARKQKKAAHTSNENKISDGYRKRAPIEVEVF